MLRLNLQDALLGPRELHEYGQPCLEALAHETVAIPKEQVLGHLLGNRARAAQLLLSLLARPDDSRMELRSKPAWKGNCWSSEATTAIAA